MVPRGHNTEPCGESNVMDCDRYCFASLFAVIFGSDGISIAFAVVAVLGGCNNNKHQQVLLRDYCSEYSYRIHRRMKPWIAELD